MEIPKLSPKQSVIGEIEIERENNNVAEWSAHNEVKLVQQHQQHLSNSNTIYHNSIASNILTSAKTEPCDMLFPPCHSSLMSPIIGQTHFSYSSVQPASPHLALLNYNNHQQIHNQLQLHHRQQHCQQQQQQLQEQLQHHPATLQEPHGESRAATIRSCNTDLRTNHDEASMSSVADAEEQLSNLNSTESVNNGQNNAQLLDISLVECIVCCDKSSGKHYGQFTCEGCKSFFKRSVRRNLTYSCRGNRSCPVDIQHRNQCQYCRYQKCIKSGMRREAVQRGRVPPSGSVSNYGGIINDCSRSDWSAAESSSNLTPPQLAYCLGSFVHALIKADRGSSYQANGSAHAGLDMMTEHSTRILITAVQFVKDIPHFSNLHISDQAALLQHCWHQLFILSASQFSLQIPPASLMTSMQMNVGTERLQVYIDTLRLLPEIMEKLKLLQTDIGEYACLKALVVFNSDVWNLQDSQSVEGIQEKVQCALEEYCRIKYPSQPARFGRLLMRLPILHFISQQAIEQLFFFRLISKTSMDTILREILFGPISTTNNLGQHSALQHQHQDQSLPHIILPGATGGISSGSSYSTAAAMAYSQLGVTLPSVVRPSNNF